MYEYVCAVCASDAYFSFVHSHASRKYMTFVKDAEIEKSCKNGR